MTFYEWSQGLLPVRSVIERQSESSEVHAKSLAASRQDGGVASSWRRIRLVFHQSERNIRLRASPFRVRLPSQDRRDRSAAGKDQEGSARCIAARNSGNVLQGASKWH